MTFLMERAPPLVFLLLAAGPCLSGLQAVEGHIDLTKFLWAVIGELVSDRVRCTSNTLTVFLLGWVIFIVDVAAHHSCNG